MPELFNKLRLLDDEPTRSHTSDHLGLDPFARIVAGTAVGTPGPFTINVHILQPLDP